MKEYEIRPKELFEQFLELSGKDIEKYFDNEDRLVIPCPACFSEENKFAFSKNGFDFVECEKCLTLYLSPRPSLSQFEQFYIESPSSEFMASVFFPTVEESRRKKIVEPRAQRILEMCKIEGLKLGNVVDVGAGSGIFLEEFQKKQPESLLFGVEPSPRFSETCRKKGFSVLEELAENAGTWKEKADLVTCFEVIEHAHNPFKFVKSLYELLKKNGMVVLTGLGCQGFDIQTLWGNSKSVTPPHHINFFSIKGFKVLFEKVGFEKVEVITPGKLDVDIVLNAIKEDSSINIDRFLKILLEKDGSALEEFQNFLAKHKLSSHCWIKARKPEQ